MRDLTDLAPGRHDAGLNKLQWMEVLFCWINEERAFPSPTSMGYGGGPIDSNYILLQMVTHLSVDSDAQALDWLLASPRIGDEGTRDIIRLALGFQGDRRQVPALIRMVSRHPNPFLRSWAVTVLGHIGAVEAIPVLEQAQQDPYKIDMPEEIARDPRILYPVRFNALYALRTLRDQDHVAKGAPPCRAFAARLVPAGPYAAGKEDALTRLVAAANHQRAKARDPLPAADMPVITLSLSATHVVVGEPLYLEYHITNHADVPARAYGIIRSSDCLTISVTGGGLDLVIPGEELRSNPGTHFGDIPIINLPANASKTGRILITGRLRFPTPGSYQVTARIRVPYVVAPVDPVFDGPRRGPLVPPGLPSVQVEKTWCVRVRPYNQRYLSEWAADLLKALLTNQTSDIGTEALVALFSLPEEAAAPVWDRFFANETINWFMKENARRLRRLRANGRANIDRR